MIAVRQIAVHKTAVLVAALMLGLGLSGCVTLFPKTKPIQLYRFGVETAAEPSMPPIGVIKVLHAPTTFVKAAEGDRILTALGQETAYVADARWVSPAAVLFDEAEARAFSDGPVQLVRRGGVASAPFNLRLDVETFEARYADVAHAAPTVVIEVRAELNRVADRQVAAVRTFRVEKRAADNRVGAIVEAFNGATADILGQIGAWTASQGR